MSGVTVTVVGDKAVVQILEKMSKDVAKALLKGTYIAGKVVEGTARMKVLRGPRSGKGRVYKRGKTIHRASAPGEPPANDLGNLQRSIQTLKSVDTGSEVVCEVKATAKYAMPLEFGTLDGKIEERPFMRPSLEENKDKIKQIIETEVAKVVKP